MKITLIYLAAGSSKRFGDENKLLYPINGVPMYRCLLDRLVKICARHEDMDIVVVSRYDEIAAYAEQCGIGYTDSPDSEKGISFSIRAGLKSCPDSDACVFFTADQPYFTEESAEGFLLFMKNGGHVLGCVSCGGESGNPVWFSRRYFGELLALDGDRGGKRVMNAHLDECVMYEIPDGREMRDIDVKE